MVKIRIMAKQLRLLGEGRGDDILITLPAGSSAAGGELSGTVSSLKITSSSGKTEIYSDRSGLPAKDSFTVSGPGGSVFRLQSGSGKRTYPLPLEVIIRKESPLLIICEDPERYAADAASAELGRTEPEYREALHALACVIRARTEKVLAKKMHRPWHFCDMTCCHFYRGRTGISLGNADLIIPDLLKQELFFHSSCGGRLFTESVFTADTKKISPPEDRIYSRCLLLSRGEEWQASVSSREISEILFPENRCPLYSIDYSMDREQIILFSAGGEKLMAPETFRIKINRKKGWNFIKSNNYIITKRDSSFIFSGRGLGHGTGMSLQGALELSERGYSSYEILKHYFPGIPLQKFSAPLPSGIQYALYRKDTMETVSVHGNSFLKRRVPCGSLFKLVTSAYLASARRDLLHSHIHICRPDHTGKTCWYRKGHGRVNFSRALYLSCNSYFASLAEKIDRTDFLNFARSLSTDLGLGLEVPHSADRSELARLLCGLDFRASITVEGIARLSSAMACRNSGPAEYGTPAEEERQIIMDALQKTFTEGTAAPSSEKKSNRPELPGNMWGKTGTVIAGTNSHCSYGIFTGGAGILGIVAVLPEGTGGECALQAASILQNFIRHCR